MPPDGQSTEPKTKKRRSGSTTKGVDDKCVAAVETRMAEEVKAIGHLEERTREEEGILSDVLHSFHLHMQKDPTKAKSNLSYVTSR